MSFPKPKDIIQAKSNTLKICSWNVAGLRACIKKGAFTSFLTRVNPDILCLSETKCKLNQIDIDLKKYNVYWHDTKSKKGYAGVGILSKKVPINVFKSPLGFEISDGRIINMEFSEFYLINTYVPNAGENLKFMERKRTWNEKLREYILKLEEKKPVIWTGDLNVAYMDVDVYDGKTNKNRKLSAGFTDYEREHFTEYFTKHNFVDVYREFFPNEIQGAMTFWSYLSNNRAKNRGWRLDYFVVSQSIKSLPKKVWVDSNQMGSDHAPIGMEIEINAGDNRVNLNSEIKEIGTEKRKIKQKKLSDFINNKNDKSKIEKTKKSSKNIDKTLKNKNAKISKIEIKSKKILKNEKKIEKITNNEKITKNGIEKQLIKNVDWEKMTEIKLENDWDNFLQKEFEKSYFKNIIKKLKELQNKNIEIFPPFDDIFNAFKLTPLKIIKVVIIGQDPYHKKGQANGLCFSVNKNVALPPSLKNIFKEAANDLKIPVEKFCDGYLGKWAKQGVFLLNSILTVSAGEAKSHKKFNWEIFTDNVVSFLNQFERPLVFILWGNDAINKCKMINTKKHFILKCAHPSPLSAQRGFLGSNIFSKCNSVLNKIGQNLIEWNLK